MLIVKSSSQLFPTCTLQTDSFHLPTANISVPLSFAYCRPSKFSRDTLGASGSVLGLAPSEYLNQIESKSPMAQLLENKIIERPIFSLMLINGQTGVLSVGGTGAGAVELVEQQTKDKLDHVGAVERGEASAEEEVEALTKRTETNAKLISSKQKNWEESWRWSSVQGAEGWWQILMQGVWVDGSKVLQNQAAVIDVSILFLIIPFPPQFPRTNPNIFLLFQINTPFILAPPSATKAFYASISGSRALPAPYSNFYVFPCLNPPKLHFEFGRWTFPLMEGGRGADWSVIPGGKFSLGRLRDGSGYCVGAVVETRMGVREERDGMAGEGRGGRKGTLAGNGMRDVWVIGEGFFRGVGAVFNVSDRASFPHIPSFLPYLFPFDRGDES